jgi:putative ABC transport system permease protein
MWGMSRAGLAERWTLFAGALLSVALGVALVQSSLLLLITAATLDPPPGLSPVARMTFADNVTAAVAMLGVTLGAATFLAGFVISSTFAFTVTQRRRDLALLRLVGAGRGQLRRLLLGEAVLLGGLGAALGIPAGVGVMAVQALLMRRLGFVPAGFTGRWQLWIIGVSIGTGIALAGSGALVAAWRAARVRPLEALRDVGGAARVMTVSRWLAGLVFTGGALAMIIVAPRAGATGGQAVTMNVAMPAAIALAALAPLAVPLVARLIPTGVGVVGGLARANLFDARRRSASIAAPLIVLVGLVLGNAAAATSFTESGIGELRHQLRADLVVEATGPVGPAVAAVPGVAGASTETSIPATVTVGEGDHADTDTVSALVVDPTSYVDVHAGSAPIGGLHGRAVAAGPGGDVPAHGTVRVRLPGTDLGALPVAAAVPATMSGGASLLLPPGLVPPALLAQAPTRSFVRLADGADRAAVRAALAHVGTVADLDAWLKADAAARTATSDKVMVIVMGLGGLYALLGVVNSVVIGAAVRRREFAEARITGLTRAQVVRCALLESSAVTVSGLILGGLAAGGTFVAALATTKAVTGVATLVLPWPLVVGVAGVALAVTGVTSVVTTWSATRPAPVTVLGTQE